MPFSEDTGEKCILEQFIRFSSGFNRDNVEKLSIYTHSRVFFGCDSCVGMRKIYICIVFGSKILKIHFTNP